MTSRFRTQAGAIAALLLAAAAGAGAQSAADNRADADQLAKALNVSTGSTVCEVGAGSGELTVLMAEAVGPSGKVYSNDLNPDRRAEIARAAAAAGLSNVTVVEGAPAASNIAPGTCDSLFMRNVYHHFGDPASMNADLFRALKPGSRIAVIDFTPRGTESADPKGRADEAHHGVTPATVVRELAGAGFTDLQSSDLRGGFIVVGVRPSR
ncbi:MAG TPA: methyltransferase domain-containing protein [Vicinamibacterales bacterium]|nr:methyltransferase domain-containing protein [Vicinamibacterales bacterium]